MTDRPILFSGPMVRAIMEWRKTQTRRVLRPQPGQIRTSVFTPSGLEDTHGWEVKVPYFVGDRLWVREAWRTEIKYDKVAPRDVPEGSLIDYIASGPTFEDELAGKSRPSMFMPRWASRLTLTVTDVRVQRLQEISEEDAIAEGVERCKETGGYWGVDGDGVGGATPRYTTAALAFHRLWDRLNHKRGYGWNANPWVVTLTFTFERRNIDEIAQ